MNSGTETGHSTTADADAYEAPKLEVLGSLAELTLQGNAPPDELLNDGSQA